MTAVFPAITIWQPWASLIAAGAKPYEFRRWPAPRSLVGKRVAIHAGARKVRPAEVQELILCLTREEGRGTGLKVGPAMDVLDRHWHSLPLASVLCIATLGQPRKASAIFAGEGDSDRIDHHVWAWPLTDIRLLEPFEPARGAQGWWNWRAPDNRSDIA